MTRFARLDRLPPYVFATVNQIKMEARRAGEDIIDLGMGNPDIGTPQHIVDKLAEAVLGILGDDERRRFMAGKAADDLEDFGRDHMVRQLEELYRWMAGSNRC